MLNIIPEKLALIFNAKSIEESCSVLNSSLEQLRNMNVFSSLPTEYQNIAIQTPEEVQAWFDRMKNESREVDSDFFGLFEATLGQLRKFGFHRNYIA